MKLNSLQEKAMLIGKKKEEVIKGMIYNLADDAIQELGVAPDSPTHLALIRIAQDTWDLRDALEEKGYW